MFKNQFIPARHRLQYSLAVSGLAAGAAAVLTFFLIALVLMWMGMQQHGDLLAMYIPQLHLFPTLMPQGVLGEAVWLFSLTLYSGLLVGLPTFAIVYLGRAELN